jgi:hypothetical protein
MTPRIDIDDAVFTHLQSKAIAFVETPNDTLRRLLGIESTPKPAGRTTRVVRSGKMERKPKASLGRLIQAGLLKNGQKLVLHDYQGREVPNAVAYIGGDGIFASLDRKRLYSMSDLAQELLKKQGYQSDSVRGPAHWYAEDGRSISEIWESYLEDLIDAV